MNGIICIDKPQGFTSFDVIAKLRGILKMKRIGHAGTLDPMATGVLPVFVGYATKACDIMPDNKKAYRACFKLGMETDTLDSTGTTLRCCEVVSGESDIEDRLADFRGSIMQIPPMYSAVSVNGKRLYELARQGVEVERTPRNVFIHRLELEDYNAEVHEGILSIECSKGTYVRTIIDDIGKALGCGAVMTGLVRTLSNGFNINECVTLDEIQKKADDDTAGELVIPIERVFRELPEIFLDADTTVKYKNGVKLSFNEFKAENYDEAQRYRIFSADKIFLGLAYIKDNCLRVYKNFS